MNSLLQTLPVEHALADFEQLLDISSSMLDSSSKGNWKELMERESRYINTIQELERKPQGKVSDPNIECKKSKIIEQLMERSVEIRRRLVSRRDEICSMINQSHLDGNNVAHVYILSEHEQMNSAHRGSGS